MKVQEETIERIQKDVTVVAVVTQPTLIASILSRFAPPTALTAAVISAPCEPTPDDELYEERAAIRQYDGGLSRIDSEMLARHDMTETARQSPTMARHHLTNDANRLCVTG